MEKLYRHGDLCIKRVAELPKGLKKKKDAVLALGEITGHSHVLVPLKKKVQVYENEQGQVLFEVEQEAKLTHQEHKTIIIGKGIYTVIREREYNPFEAEIRQVLD